MAVQSRVARVNDGDKYNESNEPKYVIKNPWKNQTWKWHLNVAQVQTLGITEFPSPLALEIPDAELERLADDENFDKRWPLSFFLGMDFEVEELLNLRGYKSDEVYEDRHGHLWCDYGKEMILFDVRDALWLRRGLKKRLAAQEFENRFNQIKALIDEGKATKTQQETMQFMKELVQNDLMGSLEILMSTTDQGEKLRNLNLCLPGGQSEGPSEGKLTTSTPLSSEGSCTPLITPPSSGCMTDPMADQSPAPTVSESPKEEKKPKTSRGKKKRPKKNKKKCKSPAEPSQERRDICPNEVEEAAFESSHCSSSFIGRSNRVAANHKRAQSEPRVPMIRFNKPQAECNASQFIHDWMQNLELSKPEPSLIESNLDTETTWETPSAWLPVQNFHLGSWSAAPSVRSSSPVGER